MKEVVIFCSLPCICNLVQSWKSEKWENCPFVTMVPALGVQHSALPTFYMGFPFLKPFGDCNSPHMAGKDGASLSGERPCELRVAGSRTKGESSYHWTWGLGSAHSGRPGIRDVTYPESSTLFFQSLSFWKHGRKDRILIRFLVGFPFSSPEFSNFSY